MANVDALMRNRNPYEAATAPGVSVQVIRGRAESAIDALADTLIDLSQGSLDPTSYRDQYRWAWRLVSILLDRLEIENPNEWREIDDFLDTYRWFEDETAEVTVPQARKDVRAMYRSVHDALMAIDRRRLGRHVAEVSTGWPDVDEKIETLRQQFAKADSADDWRDVGRRCDGLMEAVGKAVVARLGLDLGETSPKDPKGIAGLLAEQAVGPENKKLRKLLTESSELSVSGSMFLQAASALLGQVAQVAAATDTYAQSVKHAARTEHQAAIAAEGTIMFASMVRHAVALIEVQAEDDEEQDAMDSAE